MAWSCSPRMPCYMNLSARDSCSSGIGPKVAASWSMDSRLPGGVRMQNENSEFFDGFGALAPCSMLPRVPDGYYRIHDGNAQRGDLVWNFCQSRWQYVPPASYLDYLPIQKTMLVARPYR